MIIFLLQLCFEKCWFALPRSVAITQGALRKKKANSKALALNLLRPVFEDKPGDPSFMKSSQVILAIGYVCLPLLCMVL